MSTLAHACAFKHRPLPKHAVVQYRRYSFPGLQDGDQWCLCASRWAQAHAAGMAPKVHLAATHERTLEHATLDQLLEHAVDREAAERTIKELDALRSSLEKQLE